MPVTVQTLERTFKYHGLTLADPDPALPVAAVLDFYASQYPELANAKPIKEIKPDTDGETKEIHTFHIAAGTKG